MASINSVMSMGWAVVGNNLLPFVPYTSIGAVDADKSSRVPTEPVENGLRLCGNDGAVYTGKADDTGTGQYLFPAHVFSLHKALLSGDSCGR